MGILNYEFSFCLFAFCQYRYSSVQLQWFCLSGRDCCDAFVRRSHTCGYEGYCLSGKSEQVNWKFFGLEKPNFHNRRIHSAAWIVVRNLPERQYFYLPRRHKDAKSSDYRNSSVNR